MQEWITAAEREHPAKGYQLRAGQLQELAAAADKDVTAAIAAAYNMGFKRGRNYERNHRKSLAAIKRALLWEAGQEQETKRALLDLFREQCSMEDAADLIAVIHDKMKEAAAHNPEAAAYFSGMNTAERAAWAVKEAYCIGQVEGHAMAQEVTRQALESLSAQ